MSGPILKLATGVLVDVDNAILHAPHTNPAREGTLHIRALQGVRKGLQVVVNLAGEEVAIEQEHAGPRSVEAMLGELVEAVQLQGGRLGIITPDRVGVDAALAALREMGPVLGRTHDDRAALLEAVRAQDATCTLELYTGANLGSKVTETIKDYPTPRVPMVADEFELPDGRLARVKRVTFVGREVRVLCRVWAAVPKRKPGEPEDTF